MDETRFDSFTRSLTVAGSRRRTLRLLAGTLGLLGWSGRAEVAAHDYLAGCRLIKSQKKRSKCVRKAKKHNKIHKARRRREQTSSLPPSLFEPPPPPPPPTCAGNGTGCTVDSDCCQAPEPLFCQCGQSQVCAQLGTLGTGACCKRNEECLQQCVKPAGHATGVCCDPADPESCVCQNCGPCVQYGQRCNANVPCCDGVPCLGGTCRFN